MEIIWKGLLEEVSESICLQVEIHKDGLYVFVTQSWSM